MPPHCDSMDGPVVTAARRAMDQHDPEVVLPYVPAEAEGEVTEVFDLAIKASSQGPEAREAARRLFFETVVRLHRAGEGAPFTGLKPPGLDVGPVIPVVERAIESGDPDELVAILVDAVRDQTLHRFSRLLAAREAVDDTASARTHVEQMLGLQVWAHHLYQAVHGGGHDHRSG